ncbi:probable RNA-binding protein 46 [Trichonephila clavata]|uniref:Probable RNA-binding protein 46 n=1 Tax=Trichonephila clavata TaxID=2740835 RepID=A0A8X6JCL0_TRICU|nr:probable RNA-binding protein 46 [Trichonephila clavata]
MKYLRSSSRYILQRGVVKVLYVRNLAPVTTEDQLLLLFSMGGALRVERVKKMRDFAFVHYNKREDAENALGKFDGVTVDGCTLEVTWAKPPETQKQRSSIDKRDALSNLYRQINYDGLENNFDFNLLQNAGFSMFPRGNVRSRFPVSTFPNLKNTFTITRPIQLLNYICLENGWGEPEYHVSCLESEPSELFFVCWVLISGFPLQNQKFMSDRVCKSPEEARYYAASYVLKKLNITDADGPIVSPPNSLNNTNSFTSLPKNFSANNSLSLSKTANASNLNFCSSPKTIPPPKPFKAPGQMPFCFGERGQGDVGNFMMNSQAMDNCNFDDLDTSSLLDPNTSIEPNSLLGLIASMAVASSNTEMPMYNKPKL